MKENEENERKWKKMIENERKWKKMKENEKKNEKNKKWKNEKNWILGRSGHFQNVKNNP